MQTPGFISSEAKDRLQGYTYALGVRITKTGIRSVKIFRDTRPENLNQFHLNIRYDPCQKGGRLPHMVVTNSVLQRHALAAVIE